MTTLALLYPALATAITLWAVHRDVKAGPGGRAPHKPEGR